MEYKKDARHVGIFFARDARKLKLRDMYKSTITKSVDNKGNLYFYYVSPDGKIDLFEKSNVGVSIEPAMWINLSEELVID